MRHTQVGPREYDVITAVWTREQVGTFFFFACSISRDERQEERTGELSLFPWLLPYMREKNFNYKSEPASHLRLLTFPVYDWVYPTHRRAAQLALLSRCVGTNETADETFWAAPLKIFLLLIKHFFLFLSSSACMFEFLKNFYCLFSFFFLRFFFLRISTFASSTCFSSSFLA